MSSFVSAVAEHTFLQNALIAAILTGICSGVVGTYVVVRRITVIAGSIAHCVLGGIGAALFFSKSYDLPWLTPMLGAVIAALMAALLIGAVSMRARQREDMVIAAVWSIGMAVGVLFIYKTPGYQPDPLSYLFGNIMMVTSSELWMIALLDAVVIAVAILYHQHFVAICFDEEFARLRGINVEACYLLLLCISALTVVLLVKVVGIVMVIALLTLPVAVAGAFTRSMLGMMILSSALAMFFSISGMVVSFKPNIPSGATTIVIAGATYLIVLAGSALVKRRRRNAKPTAAAT